MHRHIILKSLSTINVPLIELQLLSEIFDARLDIENEEMVFEEIIIDENVFRKKIVTKDRIWGE